MELSDAPEKNPQWLGIDPGTLRLVAQYPIYSVYTDKLQNGSCKQFE